MERSSRRAGTFTLGHAAVVAVAVLAFGCEQGQVGGGAVSAQQGAMTVDHVVTTGQVCAPTGKHANHQAFACATCHQCAGTLSFDPNIAGPSATFDPTAKTCSNVKCHGVTSGTFTYSSYDWGADAYVNVSVPYGGSSSAGPANWYATDGSGGCNACHGYPPTYNGVAYPWHSGAHGVTTPNGNTCQLCHPDVTGAYVYSAYLSSSGGMVTSCPPGTYCSAPGTITVPTQHANGTLDVVPQWGTRCMGCH
jgi:predicted CxxxxCH...CXXCH cytochrome family protein